MEGEAFSCFVEEGEENSPELAVGEGGVATRGTVWGRGKIGVTTAEATDEGLLIGVGPKGFSSDETSCNEV